MANTVFVLSRTLACAQRMAHYVDQWRVTSGVATMFISIESSSKTVTTARPTTTATTTTTSMARKIDENANEKSARYGKYTYDYSVLSDSIV